jgi:hypothetical protein
VIERTAARVDVDAARVQALGEADAFLERLLDLLVVQVYDGLSISRLR